MSLENIDRLIAEGDKIFPNFPLIAKYYEKMHKERFYLHYPYFKTKGIYKEADKIIINYDLQNFRSDLFYFFVELAQNYLDYRWSEQVSLASVKQKEVKQTLELIDFLSETITLKNNLRLRSHVLAKMPAIKTIKFITDKNKVLTIDSYPLCYDILDLIQTKFQNEKDRLTKALSKKNNINSRQYHKSFVLSLTPLINYLDAESKAFSSKNKIYQFVADFINLFNDELNLDYVMIKDILKASKNTGRNSPKK